MANKKLGHILLNSHWFFLYFPQYSFYFFLKVIVEEFEEKVFECHNKAADDEAGFQRVAKASQKAAMRKNKQKIKGSQSYNLSVGFCEM